ncbi:polysaccharide deacetylase family protein [Thalassotalea agarivorans]|uniref:Polysaccharide deacetylase n=1 Tax=Thalassotalea agarivorans TaxID=349064 RepID=A0A1I0HND6_THASX|nr:polysaccharide deacetylase family protein [Thalassotalea agarivorans]SET85508.1 Polysaccharide deacetylase [Thalassotalea agarivorans]
MKSLLLSLWLIALSPATFASVILQYHHVSDSTPASTSISPAQFEKHMQFLKDNDFKVIALSEMVERLKKGEALEDKTVVITFDDAYTDILENGVPILKKYNYPYTIFVNPGIVNRGSKSYLSWQQLKKMGDEGAIIANHGWEHDSMARISDGMEESAWTAQYIDKLKQAEQKILDETGQTWKYFAYPYGEYVPNMQKALLDEGFVSLSQQSGAVGLNTDLSSIPRFPASKPYDKLRPLRDKLNSLAFNISLEGEQANTLYKVGETQSVTFTLEVDDFYKSMVACFISGLGKQKINWISDNQFRIDFSAPLPPGRQRCNCTAPSISKPGRYYWYSKPWFILKEDGSWYHL